MYTVKDYPAWMQLPPQEDSGVPPRWKITSHALGLTVTLILSWFYVVVIAELFGREAYFAAAQNDFSGLGAARADFDIRLLFLPIIGCFTYWVIRLVIGAGRWLWMTAARRLEP